MKTLLDCGHEESEHSDLTTGYGTDNEGKKYCYACCAEQDREQMRKDGDITLYLHNGKVTNWPSSLVFVPYHERKGRHNIAGTRTDVWFSFEGTTWHGTQYGSFSEICRCKLVKSSK